MLFVSYKRQSSISIWFFNLEPHQPITTHRFRTWKKSATENHHSRIHTQEHRCKTKPRPVSKRPPNMRSLKWFQNMRSFPISCSYSMTFWLNCLDVQVIDKKTFPIILWQHVSLFLFINSRICWEALSRELIFLLYS